MRTFLVLIALALLSGFAFADDAAVTTISPVYSELVAFSLPSGFVTVHQNAGAKSYIREAVLKGETVDKWTQMITVTGAEGMANLPNVTPESAAGGIAAGYQGACPASYVGGLIKHITIAGHQALLTYVSCGSTTAITGSAHSESLLLITVVGKEDLYTLQWAERGAASDTPVKFDTDKWVDRFKALLPIKFCPVVKGEKPPYPSCLGKS
jgi:hypothetical protein